MNNLLSVLLTAITANLIFTKALGISTITASAKSKTDFVGIGLMVTILTTLGCGITYGVNQLFPALDIAYRPVAYILALAVLYIFLLVFLHAVGRPTFYRFRKYVHLCTFNCAVLGTLLLNAEQSGSLSASLRFGLTAGLGFVIGAWTLKAVYPKLTSDRVPASVRGYPAILLYIGILSMALYATNII